MSQICKQILFYFFVSNSFRENSGKLWDNVLPSNSKGNARMVESPTLLHKKQYKRIESFDDVENDTVSNWETNIDFSQCGDIVLQQLLKEFTRERVSVLQTLKNLDSKIQKIKKLISRNNPPQNYRRNNNERRPSFSLQNITKRIPVENQIQEVDKSLEKSDHQPNNGTQYKAIKEYGSLRQDQNKKVNEKFKNEEQEIWKDSSITHKKTMIAQQAQSNLIAGLNSNSKRCGQQPFLQLYKEDLQNMLTQTLIKGLISNISIGSNGQSQDERSKEREVNQSYGLRERQSLKKKNRNVRQITSRRNRSYRVSQNRLGSGDNQTSYGRNGFSSVPTNIKQRKQNELFRVLTQKKRVSIKKERKSAKKKKRVLYSGGKTQKRNIIRRR